MDRQQIMELITTLELPEDNTFVNSFNEYADIMEQAVLESDERSVSLTTQNEQLIGQNTLLREQLKEMFQTTPLENNTDEETEQTFEELFV